MGEHLNYPFDSLRFKYFVKESAEHPAKLEIRTLQWLIERYSQPGDTVMDPMSGIGTVHIGATVGRNTIGIEISDRFAEIQQMNIQKLRKELGFTSPQEPLMLLGDCRRWLPLEEKVDLIPFSPPYGSIQKAGTTTGFKDLKTGEKIWGQDFGYSEQDANIGNITNYPLYMEAMKMVYLLCNRSLKMGGVLALVTKDYIQKNERVYVSKDNARVGVEVGFDLEDWHLRNAPIRAITQGTHIKRRQAKGTDRQELHIEVEDILIFRKMQDI